MSLTPSSKKNSCPLCEDDTGKCRQGKEDLNYWQCINFEGRKGQTYKGYTCTGMTKCKKWSGWNKNPSPPKFHPDFLKEVEKHADIVEVVSGYIELKRQGKEFAGCCPFHNENTPSFTVTPSKALAYCFGCQWGGNAIKFLMEVGRISFADAVLDLARSTGVQIRYEDNSTEYNYPDPLPRPLKPKPIPPKEKKEKEKGDSEPKDYTVDEWRVNQSVGWLLSGTGYSAKALDWLQRRGISREMIKHHRVGLEKRVVTPDQSQPENKESYSAIAIFIPVTDRPGRFHIKKRVAPWLTGEDRPSYLANWAQFGLPATIWFTYNPSEAQETWFCEGEWDALMLGELARQRGEHIAVACSTSGAGTIPKAEELNRLRGQVKIFFDRDEAGEKGAQKLAATLQGRGKIALVPMPEDCQTKGWDVSNAIQAGYQWDDFEGAAESTSQEATPCNKSGVRFRTVRKSLDEFLKTFPELNSDSGKDWLKMRKFTPDHVINSKYFDWESNQPGVHLAVKSNLGTGKTYHIHTKFLADDNLGANAFGYRNALLTQFCEGVEDTPGRKDWYHLQQDLKNSKEDLTLLAAPQSRIAACFDSLTYFQGHHFENKRLVLDETEGSFKHLYESKTAVSFRRQLCKQRAGEAIANSEAVALLDGNLTDLTVAHVERISGKKFTKVENLYKGNRGKVTLYTGTLKLKKDEESGKFVVAERRINDYSLLQKMMLEDEEPFICGSDSQEKLEAWDDLIKAKGIKTFRLDGTNSNTAEAKKFLRNPKKYIRENKIQVVLYSPTAESGLSIDLVDYFKRCYFYFFGVVLTNEQIQFLGRLRDSNAHIYVYCQNQHQKCGSPEIVSEDMQKFFVDYALACSQLSLADLEPEEKQQQLTKLAADLIQKSSDAHFQYECHLQAREVFERNHLRKCLEYAIRCAGYQVETVTGYRVGKKEADEAKEAVQVRKSKEIFEARTLTPDEVQEKVRNFEATRQDKIEVTKQRLLSRLPGIESKVSVTSKIVTLPVEAVKEIEQGLVSEEIAQKLGIPTSETLPIPALELGHLPQNSLNNQGEGAPSNEGNQPTTETVQNPGVASPEMPTTQALKVRHLPPNFSIKPVEGVPSDDGGQVQVEVKEICPVFDADFIRKVKFQDRTLISQVELHYLLEHPEIPKLIQQRRWHKKLQLFTDPNEPDCVKRLNLTTYKSDWLKVHTLLEMGIEYFLQPGARWSKDTPEAIQFWEKGKDSRIARYIGTTVGDSKPCEYIGRILAKLDVKTRFEKVRDEVGEQHRIYRVNEEYLSSPLRKAIYECVETRINATIQSDSSVLNWDAVIENQWSQEIPQNPCAASPESFTTQGVEASHLPQDYLNNQGEGVPTDGGSHSTSEIFQSPSVTSPESSTTQGVEVSHLPQDYLNNQGEGASIDGEGQSNPVWELVEAFKFCELPHQFAAVIKGYAAEVVEDAIALADSQPRRKQLTDWHQQLAQWLVGRGEELAQEDAIANPPLESYSEGDEVWFYHPSAEAKWIRGVVEWVRDRMVRVKSGFLGRLIENPHQIEPADWVFSGG